MPTLKKQETAYLHILGQVIQREFAQSLQKLLDIEEVTIEQSSI